MPETWWFFVAKAEFDVCADFNLVEDERIECQREELAGVVDICMGCGARKSLFLGRGHYGLTWRKRLRCDVIASRI